MATQRFVPMNEASLNKITVPSKVVLGAQFGIQEKELTSGELKDIATQNGVSVAQLHNLTKTIEGFEWTTYSADSVTTNSSGDQLVSFNIRTSGAVMKT